MNPTFPKRTAWLLLLGLIVIGLGFRPAWRSATISYRLSQAHSAMAHGDHLRAIELLKSVEQMAPTRADVQYWLGVASRRATQFDKSSVYLQRARRGGWPQADLERQALLQQFQMGDLAEINRRMTSLPDDASDEVAEEFCEALSQGFLALGRLPEAQFWLNKWIEIRPRATAPRMMLADIHVRVERSDLARKQWSEVLAIAPDDRTARQKLASSLLDSSKLREAADEFQRILKLAPGDPEAQLGLAQARLRLGEADLARELLTAALQAELAPHSRAKALADVASLDLADGQVQQAIDHLTEAQRLFPGESNIHYKLGQCLRQVGRDEEAKQHLAKAREVQELKAKIGQLGQDMIQNPDDANIRYEMGAASLELGQAAEGVQWLTSAVMMDPKHRRAHERLLTYYEELGDAEHAFRHRSILQRLGEPPPADAAHTAEPEDEKQPLPESGGTNDATSLDVAPANKPALSN